MAERPRPAQVLSMVLLIGMAWLSLIPLIAPRVNAFVALLLVLRLASLRWRMLAPGRWLLLLLTLAGMAGVLSAYHSFFGLEAGTALLASMSALKLLEMRRLRDVRVGAVLFGFLLVSQLLLDQSPARALYLALLLVLDIALLADLSTRIGDGPRPLAAALRTAGRLCLQALPLALVLFLLFPRLSAPLWSLPIQPDRAWSGMKDWLEPGSLSSLALSAEPAFRVRFEGPVPPASALYWRGALLWHTDGQRWTGWPRGAPLGTARPLITAGARTAYRVELEPTGKRWLFALDLPVAVPADARILGDFQVLGARPVDDTRIYRAVSALRYDSGDLDPVQRRAGTQLPDNITRRMRALVAGWKQGAGDPQSIAQRALAFFHDQPFYYTLAPPRLGANAADGFLFETRRGFCEHYASSFALLMRIAGIPARIVLGYMGGEHNPLGDYLIVRQSDAHAWVELWLHGRGWVRIDPTAAVAPERIERGDLPAGLGAGIPLRFRLDDLGGLERWIHNLHLLGDAIRTGWRSWVLGLDRERQQRMLDALGLGHLEQYGLAAALIAAATLVLGLLLAALTRRPGPRDALEKIYARFCKRLSRIGLERGMCEGPWDYSRRVIAARPDLRRPVESFMGLYLPLRYGANDSQPAQRELAAALRRFRPRHRKQR